MSRMLRVYVMAGLLLVLTYLAGILLITPLGFAQIGPAPGYEAASIPTGTVTRRLQRVSVSPEESAETILVRLMAQNNIPRGTITNIQVVDADQLNAATNGQQIIITDELWRTLQTNDQRAFVIAHELAHVVEGHIPETMLRQVGLSLISRLVIDRYLPGGDLGGVLLNRASNAALALFDLKFSRGAELEADEAGLQLMTQANYRPMAAVETLEILQAASPGSALPEFLQSHPLEESRIRALAARYQQAQQR